MRLASSAQTFVPWRAVRLIFMSVPPPLVRPIQCVAFVVTATGCDNCRLFLGVQAENALLAECRRFCGTRPFASPPSHREDRCIERAAKSSLVPPTPPDGGPVSMRHLPAWAARGRLIENGRYTKNVQQPDQTHHRGLHLWPLRLTLPLPGGATGRGSSAHKPRLRPDLPRETSIPSR